MPDLNWWLEQHFYLLTLFYFNILPGSHIYVQSISQMEFWIFSWKSHKRIQLWRVFFTLGEIYVYYIYILASYTIIYVYTCAFRFFTLRESRSGENFTEMFLFQPRKHAMIIFVSITFGSIHSIYPEKTEPEVITLW